MDPDDELRARLVGTELRKARGTMSVVEASERSGLSRQWWMDAEKGVRRDRGNLVVTVLRPENLARAIKAVGGDVDAIFELAGFDPSTFRAEVDGMYTDADGNVVLVQVKGGDRVYLDSNVITQLVTGIADQLTSIQAAIERLGDAYEQLAEQPAPPLDPPALPSLRLRRRVATKGARAAQTMSVKKDSRS